MPDVIPVIGPSRTTPASSTRSAYSGHGFQLGPATGAVLTELAVTGRSETDISGLGIERFLGQAGNGPSPG